MRVGSGRGAAVAASGDRRACVVNYARLEVVICAVWCSARRWGWYRKSGVSVL